MRPHGTGRFPGSAFQHPQARLLSVNLQSGGKQFLTLECRRVCSAPTVKQLLRKALGVSSALFLVNAIRFPFNLCAKLAVCEFGPRL